MVQIADQLAPVLNNMPQSGYTYPDAAMQRRKIEAILPLLESAMEACSTRKAQIAPLVDALNRIEERPDQP